MDTTSNTARLAETPLPELVAELAHHTSLINASRARQVELVAAITHTHTIEAEDGTLLHLPMSDTYARLDAAALVAGSLGVSQQAAQHWVDRADKLTGPLAAVHAAMADGVLDEARAKIICDELHDIPDEIAAVVADHLMPTVRAGLVEDPSGENGARLKRRVQTALAAVDPDAVKQRAEKNRSDRCLRRWTSKAGVEEWLATLPATQSIRAWAAIDALAREFINNGRSETLDQARADAMIALIEGQSTISYVITLGIPIPDHLTDPDTPAPPEPAAPAPATPAPATPEPSADGHAEAAPPNNGQHTGQAAKASDVGDSARDTDRASRPASDSPAGHAHSHTGTSCDPAGDEAGPAPDTADVTPQTRQEAAGEPATPRQGEDSVSEQPAERAIAARGERTVAEVVAAALAALARHGNTDIEITGAGNPQPTDVNAAWVADALAQAARDGKVRLAAVHPRTGALIDPHHEHATTAYVPGKALAGLVKARDGRCRFPGCTLNVRFTDLDHVRPWPAGMTSADNLHALCRRHHRIKQLVGWQVALRPDGTTLWVDPLGRRYLTRALDHRGRPQAPPTPAPAAHARSLEQQAADRAKRDKAIAHALRKEGPVSILEEHLSHDLFDLDREHNRRILHAARTGPPRPSREPREYDLHFRQLAAHTSQTQRSGKPTRPDSRGEKHRRILIDIPTTSTSRDPRHRPRRVEYDEPPF